MKNTKNQYHPQIAFHPGETLSEKLEELGISIKAFAEKTELPEITIRSLINGESSMTEGIAAKLEQTVQIPLHFWMNKQRSYDAFMTDKNRFGH